MKIVDNTLLEYVQDAMIRYGTAVNEERALPDYRDGLKPVARRILWAMKNLPKNEWIKTARVVGDVIGRYHPHGDLAVSSAIENMVHLPTSPLTGEGNWGTVIDSAAAMRYTNLKLSKYGETFINPDYLSVSEYIPNYDNTTSEPVLLPALLPNLLLNGTDGIGYGTTGRIPSFSLPSVLELMIRKLRREKLEISDYVNGLEFVMPFGGGAVKSKDNKKAIAEFFKNGTGSIQFECTPKVSKDHRRVVIDEFIPGITYEESDKLDEAKRRRRSVFEQLQDLPGVDKTNNVTDKEGVKFEILLKKMKDEDFEKTLGLIKKKFTVSRTFFTNVTERSKKENETSVKLFPSTIPQITDLWLKWRLDLEVRSLDNRIRLKKVEINFSTVLIRATDRIEEVARILKKEMDPLPKLQKLLKCSKEDANRILDMKIRRLSRMDRKGLEDQLKMQNKDLTKLEKWRKKPSKKIALTFQKILEDHN